MTVKTSIDPARLLEEQLAQASPDLLRELLGTFINTLLSAEADSVCGADDGTVSPDRVNRRNGYRHRDFDTRAGTVDLAVPKLRQGTYFPDWLLERRKRAERALTVGGRHLLPARRQHPPDGQARPVARRHRAEQESGVGDGEGPRRATSSSSGPAVSTGPFTFVAADALVLKVREGGRVVDVHALVATGVNADGHREILGLHVTTSEDGAGWLAFFRDLTARGLTGVRLVTFDAHPGLTAAIARHPARRIVAAVPHPLRGEPDERDPEELAGAGSRRCCTRSTTSPTPKRCTPSSTASSTP